jgi:Sec-independent protein translocase protein TatA
VVDRIGVVFALFESLGGVELVVVGIGALLLFGKDLPKVAADAGAQFSKFKRALDSTWRDSGLEREVRQIRDALPRDLSLRDVARSASEKLAVRLEEEDRARASDPSAAGPVPRGRTIQDALPAPATAEDPSSAAPAVNPADASAPTAAAGDTRPHAASSSEEISQAAPTRDATPHVAPTRRAEPRALPDTGADEPPSTTAS